MDLVEKLKNIKIDDKENLLEHINEVIKEMIINDEQNAYKNFEKYSEQIYRRKQKQNQAGNKLIFDNNFEMKEICQNLRQFFEISKKEKKINPEGEEDEEEQEDDEPINMGEVKDIMRMQNIISQCGISIGNEQAYYIQQSIKHFVKKFKPTKVDYWGKIFTKTNDYYILRVNIESEEEENIPEDIQQEVEEINKFKYYVSTNILDVEKWIKLPYITSQQLIQSRLVRYMFTGDLERKIIVSPVFDGQEKHLLKAQIIRIEHSTNLISRDKYIVKQEEEQDPTLLPEIEKVEIDEEDENKKVKMNYYFQKQNWVHYLPSLLKQGRVNHEELRFGEDQEIEDEEKQNLKLKVLKEDPFEERLKSITKDSTNEIKQCWVDKTYGDVTEILHPITQQPICDAVYVLQSLVWPGFSLFFHNHQTYTIYQGYGMKYQTEQYYPKFCYILEKEEPLELTQNEQEKVEVQQEEEEQENKEEEQFQI